MSEMVFRSTPISPAEDGKHAANITIITDHMRLVTDSTDGKMNIVKLRRISLQENDQKTNQTPRKKRTFTSRVLHGHPPVPVLGLNALQAAVLDPQSEQEPDGHSDGGKAVGPANPVCPSSNYSDSYWLGVVSQWRFTECVVGELPVAL